MPAPPEPELLQAEFGAAPTPAPETKPARSSLLKWGMVVLIIAVLAAGLGLLYVYAPGSTGLSAPETGPADSDDPRSKKTDRLPEAPSPPPPAQ